MHSQMPTRSTHAHLALLLVSAPAPAGLPSEEPAETAARVTVRQTVTSPAEAAASDGRRLPTKLGHSLAWADIELDRRETGEAFTIAEFSGGHGAHPGLRGVVTNVSQAVACADRAPGIESRRHGRRARRDPNEDADQVIAHIEDNGFEGTFAISPQELTDALVAEFGPAIISPPDITRWSFSLSTRARHVASTRAQVGRGSPGRARGRSVNLGDVLSDVGTRSFLACSPRCRRSA